MKKENLKLKELVTIGVFMAIYFVLMFGIGTPLGMTAVGFLFYPFVISLVSGIILMFFMAKVQKPWGLFIFAVLPGLIMTLLGHTPVLLIHSLIIAFLAEWVRRIKGYQSINGNILAYSVFCLWVPGSFLQIFIMQEAYYQMAEKMMGAAYATEMISLPPWIMIVLYVSSFIGGLLGGKLGAKVLQKHFKKAGLV